MSFAKGGGQEDLSDDNSPSESPKPKHARSKSRKTSKPEKLRSPPGEPQTPTNQEPIPTNQEPIPTNQEQPATHPGENPSLRTTYEQEPYHPSQTVLQQSPARSKIACGCKLKIMLLILAAIKLIDQLAWCVLFIILHGTREDSKVLDLNEKTVFTVGICSAVNAGITIVYLISVLFSIKPLCLVFNMIGWNLSLFIMIIAYSEWFAIEGAKYIVPLIILVSISLAHRAYESVVLYYFLDDLAGPISSETYS